MAQPILSSFYKTFWWFFRRAREALDFEPQGQRQEDFVRPHVERPIALPHPPAKGQLLGSATGKF